jgi:indoleamine 2,3-dioxygenase
MDGLPPHHFLSLLRPDADLELSIGVPDTSTLAAHDFDVDLRTGFMPPHPPLSRLPVQWEPWEDTLDQALRAKLQLGEKPGLSQKDVAGSELWRSHVRDVRLCSLLFFCSAFYVTTATHSFDNRS